MMLVARVCALRSMMKFVDDRTRHRVQPGGGFVEEDQLRLQHERAGQADAFAHAAAQLGGHLVLDVAHPHEVEFLVHGLLDLGFGLVG